MVGTTIDVHAIALRYPLVCTDWDLWTVLPKLTLFKMPPPSPLSYCQGEKLAKNLRIFFSIVVQSLILYYVSHVLLLSYMKLHYEKLTWIKTDTCFRVPGLLNTGFSLEEGKSIGSSWSLWSLWSFCSNFTFHFLELVLQLFNLIQMVVQRILPIVQMV